MWPECRASLLDVQFPSKLSARIKHWMRYALCILPFLALTKAIIHIILDHPISTNTRFYWTVHRAIQNGFESYIDIYEPKPPAIFFLSEEWSMVAGVVVLSLPLFFGRRWLFGVLMALYMLFTAQMGETEYFGAFFGTLFVLFPHWALSTVLLFLAVGFKEPLFLILLACSIVQKRERRFAASTIVVALAGIIALWLSGMYDGYVHYYLPSMFGHRIQQFGPIWLRGFFLHKFIVSFWQFSLFMIPAMALLFIQPRKELLRMALGLYLVVVAVGLGGDWQEHQFAMAVPFFTAIFLKERPAKLQKILAGLIALSIIFAPFEIATKQKNHTAEKIAASVDALLDACEVDRYLYIDRSVSWFHLTEHTPLNYFPYSQIEHLLRYHTIVKNQSIDNLAKAKIVILDGEYEPQANIALEKNFGEAFKKILQDSFTKKPWPCAEGFTVPERIVLFRNNQRMEEGL